MIERIGGDVPACGGVVMAVPVVREVALDLEPLAGEPQGLGCRACRGIHRAERLVDRLPDHGPRRIGHEVGPVEMIGVHPVGFVRRHALVDHRHGQIAEPDIFARGAGRACAIGFGQHAVAGQGAASKSP